jgi:hypothetical protein
MRLLYNDEITPAVYEPSGFKPCEFDNFVFKTSKVKLNAGNVDMRWLSINMIAHTDEKAIECYRRDAVESTVQQESSMNEQNGSLFRETRKVDCERGNLHKEAQPFGRRGRMVRKNRSFTL